MKALDWIRKVYEGTMSAFKRFFRWIKRGAFGSKTEFAEPLGEEIESPSKLLRQAFFRKKSAVTALVVLLALFAFTFLAPAFVSLDINATDPLQQNVAPNFSLRALPKGLKGKVADINGFADFTVGLSTTGKAYVWGSTKDDLSGVDLKKIPTEVEREGAVAIAAGKDHIIAVTKAGSVVGWGDDSCGQYGFEEKLNALPMSKALARGVNPERVRSLSCGYQATALVLEDGRAYLWGNTNSVRNLAVLQGLSEVKEVAFCNAFAVVLHEDGRVYTGEKYFHAAVSSKGGRQSDFEGYVAGKKVVKIAADNKCVALVTDEGELVVAGAFENGEDTLPTLREGEYFVDVVAGRRHFIVRTNQGGVYAWGDNGYGQCKLSSRNAERVFAGSLQSYATNGEGKLVQSVGLKGYLMGTDGRGRDVFARIVHGGKMTMTIGGVAVLTSSAIAILVGCVSGYFGGWVDTLLMRVTEIFSAIPFLPFAMLLSQIIKNYNLSEGMRIFIIMLILGALSWTGLARMIRGQVLSEREKEFVTAAKAMGVKEGKIAFRHILPNVVSVILVSVTLDFAGCLLTESSLSYLGFGVQQPRPTWGNMLSGSNNSTVIQNYWWQWLFPALFLSLAVICINVIGDALRDALDPKNKEK